MKDWLRYTLLLLGGVLVIGILGAGEVGPENQTWEYAVYEVLVRYDREGNIAWQRFYWYTKDTREPVTADDKKFRLFLKLGAQQTLTDYHDLVLWNHLGAQGWEYVEQFQKSPNKNTVHTQTVFRRRLDS